MVSSGSEQVQVVDGVVLSDYPSLSIIDRLREVKAYSSTSRSLTGLRDPCQGLKPITKGPKLMNFRQY